MTGSYFHIADSHKAFQNKHPILNGMAKRDDTTVIDGTTYLVAYTTQSPTFTGVLGGYTTAGDSNTASAVSSSVAPTSIASTSAAATSLALTSTRQTAAATSQSAASTPASSVAPAETSNIFSQILASSSNAGTGETLTPSASTNRATSSSATLSRATPSSSSDSSTTSSSADSGMSTAGKAGLAVGIIIAVGAVLGLILFLLSKKKRQVKAEQARQDSEKNAAIAAAAGKPAPSAPRLSLRPASSFLPEFMGGNRPKSRLSQNMLGGSTNETKEMREKYLAGGQQAIPMTEKSNPTENPFRDPENPFADPVRSAPAVAPITASEARPLHAPIPMPEPERSLAPAPLTMRESTHDNDTDRIAHVAASAGAIAAARATTHNKESYPEPIEMPIPPVSAGPALQHQRSDSSPAASPPEGNVYRILMDFIPSMDDELELRAGQVIRLLHEYDDGWCLAQKLDRSQQGAVPRTCLAAKPSKPRPAPGQGPRPMGPPGPNGRPMSPAMRGPPSRSMSPAGMGRSMSPGPRGRPPMDRSMSPGPRKMGPSPNGMRSMSPGAYNQPPRPLSPGPRGSKQRSMSPGPYGPSGRPAPMAPNQRRRSNSSSQTAREVRERRMSPPGPSPLNTAAVPGTAI
ncbi:hypothetical protein LTS08_007153 [Lithohypha guttulata]|uniref:SH3 domain-containing protein n=1 Tax=Lithohypha guttulata TaxID=1690604 RepID=A0AAN7Y7B6_9EURO|nr:hypothetical protein LTR05_003908 [Lithohypha guttulata]KAK5097132.1 hypothetical protein LTS08_007153 [Lithohypha guttulata]